VYVRVKARAVSLDKAMGLIDELSSKEESQINQKLNKEKEKKAAFNAKEKEKRQKKQDKKQKVLSPPCVCRVSCVVCRVSCAVCVVRAP
jgi:hypothetical protein